MENEKIELYEDEENILSLTDENGEEVEFEYLDCIEFQGKEDLAASLAAPGPGGLGMALAKAAMAGRLGMEIDLDAVPASELCSDAEKLYSESNGRFIATVNPAKAAEVEAALAGCTFAKVGVVTEDKVLAFTGKESGETRVCLEELIKNYKATLDQI